MTKIDYKFDDSIPEEDRKRLENSPEFKALFKKINEILDNTKKVKGEHFTDVVMGLANAYQLLRIAAEFGVSLEEMEAPAEVKANYEITLAFISKILAQIMKMTAGVAGLDEPALSEAITLAETLTKAGTIRTQKGGTLH